MHPAFSILFFTTLAGTGQGLLVLLALVLLWGVPIANSFALTVIGLAELLLLADNVRKGSMCWTGFAMYECTLRPCLCHPTPDECSSMPSAKKWSDFSHEK